MKQSADWRQGRVVSSRVIAEGVRRVEFAVAGAVPGFDPGSHLNLRVMIGGAAALRSYSCLPAAPGHLAIGVKLHSASRGGSRFVWGLGVGDSVALTMPENRFEISWRAPEYLLLAGGIGVTPIYGMARALKEQALKERGARVALHYVAQSRAQMAFVDDLQRILGPDLHVYAGEGARPDLAALIDGLAVGGELYVCGPLGMLEAVKSAWAAAGRPVSRLRYEVFGDSGAYAEQSFAVEVLNRGLTVQVRADQTLLDALTEAGVDMVYDCRRGECGLCAVTVITHDTPIDHRDVFFSPHEKATGKKICACVSRMVGGTALIDTGYRV
ncbi:MAG: PDR/VanB family oxidoreductase [Paracoccaceae bacterium]|nr:PDR/VanB family oxidoreductase [Paracoccaceae bacterium]